MAYNNNHLVTVSPSQIINIPVIALGIATAPVVVFLLYAIYKLIEYHYWRYEFYERTLIERKGVFSVTRRELHYYRIKSVYVEEPFIFRVFGLSNIYVKTSDPYLPELRIYGVEKGATIKQLLESLTFGERNENNVREFDMYHLNQL